MQIDITLVKQFDFLEIVVKTSLTQHLCKPFLICDNSCSFLA
jgi:hypothetical protein